MRALPAGKGPPVDTGHLIGARYRLDRRLAAGGMGVVWVAHDELLGRPVALKLLNPALADEERRRRFRAEARAAARLSHRGVVAVYDYGEEADVTFLAMELVDGESLHEVLRRRAPLAPEEVMAMVAQAAAALADAHDHGLVHRDVKPANLLVGPNGTVKVTDFGIARAADMTTATLEGSVLGTVAYMSPEQIRGERVGAASDVYSLGVVAYEALAGARPFPAQESIAVALSHLHDPVPALAGSVPGPVQELVASMLRKDPAARPSAARVAEQAGRLAVDWRVAPAGGPDTVPLSPLPTAPLAGPSATAPLTGAPLAPVAAEATRPAPLRTLGAALGAAALATKARAARRRPSASVISAVVVGALAVGLLLAAALPGAGPGKALAATHRATKGSVPVTAPHAHGSTTTSSSTASTTSTTVPVVATTDTHTPPGHAYGRSDGTTDQAGPGQGPPGPPEPGPGPGGPGPGGPGSGGPGPGGS